MLSFRHIAVDPDSSDGDTVFVIENGNPGFDGYRRAVFVQAINFGVPLAGFLDCAGNRLFCRSGNLFRMQNLRGAANYFCSRIAEK